MSMLKNAAAKILELVKRIPVDNEDEDGDYVAGSGVGPSGFNHVNPNGFGQGARGPNNDWGARPGPGF